MKKSLKKVLSLSVTAMSLSFVLAGCGKSTITNGYVDPNLNKSDSEIKAEEQLKKDVEQSEKIITDTSKTFTGDNMEFIDNTAQKDELNKTLYKFIIDKANNYLASGKEDKNAVLRIDYALNAIYANSSHDATVNDLVTKFNILQDKYDAQGNPQTKTTPAPTDNRLKSGDGYLVLENYTQEGHYITGTISNNSQFAYRYVEVDINLYDGSGNQIGNTIDNVTNLDGYKSWKFKAPVIDDSNVRKFQVVAITYRQ